jgi:hypothetical protein
MRLKVCSIISLVLLAAGALGFDAGAFRVHASTIQSNAPKILNARVKGKKLIVTGENFSDGAVILIDGEPQKTKNDSDFPSARLVAKKAGKLIPSNSGVTLQVQDGSGISEPFGFFKGDVVTLEDGGKTLNFKVGDRFLLFLQKGGYEFTPLALDPTILKKVDGVEVIPGSQGVFEAQRAGSTKLTAVGELPCHKTIPPCLAPSLYVEFNIVVTAAVE